MNLHAYPTNRELKDIISIVEDLLRLHPVHKNVKPSRNKLETYIKACEDNGLLKTAIHNLADSVRQFGNIIHL